MIVIQVCKFFVCRRIDSQRQLRDSFAVALHYRQLTVLRKRMADLLDERVHEFHVRGIGIVDKKPVSVCQRLLVRQWK